MERALALQSKISSPVSEVKVDRRNDFYWEANGASFGELHVSVGRYGAGVEAGTTNIDGHYGLSLARARSLRGTQGGETVDLVAGRRAALVSPAMPAHFRLDAHYEGWQLIVPARTVEDALATLIGKPARSSSIRFDLSVDIARGVGEAAVRQVDHIVEMLQLDVAALRSPIIRGPLVEAFVYTLLLGLPHSHSALIQRPARPSEPSYVERAAEYLAANAHRHVALADVVAASGASARALFAGFRTHRGSSPMAFLRDRRFDLARRRLLSRASAPSSVTEIALACGFEHLGRFSVGYRARFGESPVETLRRRQRR